MTFAVSGCGGGDDSGGDETETESASAKPGETQSDARCLPVPRALAKRTMQGLKTEVRAVATTWQMVRSRESYPSGLEKPLLVSARLIVDKNPPAIATWAVERVRTGPVIPIDGVAKNVTALQEGIDPTEYSALLEESVYVRSRSCAQEAFGVQQKKQGQAEGGP